MTDNLARNIDQARTANTAALLVAGIITALLLGWWAPWAPTLADAATRTGDTMTAGGSPVRGEVDVCVLKSDLGRSWTRGLERKANRALHQRIDVHRRGEDRLGGCDVVVWLGGRVAEDTVAGAPAANPRFHVYTGPYAMVPVEVNVGSITPRKQRPATIVDALKAAGIR